MATVYHEIVQLGSDFNNQKVRKCEADGSTWASVLDVIKPLVDGEARLTWSRLKKQHPDLSNGVRDHQFSDGKGSRPTPIASGDDILQIVLKLPGKKAKKFCSAAIYTFLKALNPTREFIEDLKDRIDTIEYGNIGATIVETTTNTFSLVQRCIDETTLYVRMRVPDEFMLDTTFVKQLTLDVLKFGITYSVNDRNGQYARDRDNGYMAFSFHCASRKEAQIIEDIMKYDFSTATVLNSREYVDTTIASEILGCDFDPSSYDSYVNVAQALYGYMLRLVHTVWDRNAHMFGYSYDIVANNSTLVHNIENDTTNIHSDLSFKCSVIGKTRAARLGIVKQPVNVNIKDEVKPATEEDYPMTRICLQGIEHRGDLTVDDVVDATTSPVNDIIGMQNKLDTFVDLMCIVDPDASVGSTDITCQYRIWAREGGRDVFSAVLKYMGKRFQVGRLPGEDKNTVVNGFKGLKIKPVEPYVLPPNPTARELFLFEMCDRGVKYKGIQVDLVNAFKDWMQTKNGVTPTDVQVRSLKDYLKNNFFKTNIWKQYDDGTHCGGMGYFGIKLKSDEHVHRNVPTTSKSIQKIHVETGEHVGEPWRTIAKAAESMGWCAAKMSRHVRDKTNFEGFMFVEV
jgi:hypothetical protein